MKRLLLLLLLLPAASLRADRFDLSNCSKAQDQASSSSSSLSDKLTGPFDFSASSGSLSDILTSLPGDSSDQFFVGIVTRQPDDSSDGFHYGVWFLSAQDFFSAFQGCGIWKLITGGCNPPSCELPGNGDTGGGGDMGGGGTTGGGGGGGGTPVPDSGGIAVVLTAGAFLLTAAKILRDRSTLPF